MNKRNTKHETGDQKAPAVLLAVSEENFAHAIAGFVERHHWPEHTNFHVLYVVEEPSIKRVLRFSPDIAQQIVEEDEEFGNRLVNKISSQLSKAMPNAKVEASVRKGFAKNEILLKAQQVGANVIALGAHTRLGVGSILLGSVSLAVMMEANCSVLVVRLPGSQATREVESLVSGTDTPESVSSFS